MTYLFLSGADMEPTAVRTAYPDARFVARARIGRSGTALAPAFGNAFPDTVWGIMIETNAPGSGETRPATTDDGRTVDAAIGTVPSIGGDPAEALAAARYWELAPAYVTLLKQALAVTDEDPSDGN